MTEVTNAAEPPQSENAAARGDYRPAVALTLWMKLLLGAGILTCLVEVVLRVLEYMLLEKIGAGGFAAAEEQAAAIAASDSRVSMVAVLRVVFFFAMVILFLFWTYRANRNARALGAQEMRFTPGWSVGWFFVPFANLVMPFKVMREIWSASSDPGNWQSKPGSPLVGWWWFLWLADSVIAQVVSLMFRNIDSVAAAQRVSAAALGHDLAQIALYAVIFALVKGIFDRQQWQSQIVTVF